MPKIVAIDGVRGVGKSTVCTQLYNIFDKPTGPISRKFPSDFAIDVLKILNFDMKKLKDIMAYNMVFIQDFMEFKRITKSDKYYSKQTYVFDRYILSNLAHFKYDLDVAGFSNLWDGVSTVLYSMFDGSFVYKPDLIIYLHGESKQPTPKFDDHLYKDRDIAPYFNSCLSDLKNKLDIPFEMVTSQRNDTFTQVEQILKTRGYI